jgi:hypothetical protein
VVIVWMNVDVTVLVSKTMVARGQTVFGTPPRVETGRVTELVTMGPEALVDCWLEWEWWPSLLGEFAAAAGDDAA